jgi:hypothetical protein
MISSPHAGLSLYALLAQRTAVRKRTAPLVAGNLTGLYLAAICIFLNLVWTRMLMRRGLIP